MLTTSIKSYSTKVFHQIIFKMLNLPPLDSEIHLMYSSIKLVLHLMTDFLNSALKESSKEDLEMINMMKNMKLYGRTGPQACLLKPNFQHHQMFSFHQAMPWTYFQETSNKDQNTWLKITNGYQWVKTQELQKTLMIEMQDIMHLI